MKEKEKKGESRNAVVDRRKRRERKKKSPSPSFSPSLRPSLPIQNWTWVFDQCLILPFLCLSSFSVFASSSAPQKVRFRSSSSLQTFTPEPQTRWQGYERAMEAETIAVLCSTDRPTDRRWHFAYQTFNSHSEGENFSCRLSLALPPAHLPPEKWPRAKRYEVEEGKEDP